MSDLCQEPPAPFDPAGSGSGVDRLLDNIQVQMPGVTTDMVTLVIWNAIEDFYQRSTLHREHVFWKLPGGITQLDFDPYDTNWRVCRFVAFRGLSRAKFTPPGRVLDLTYPTPDNERDGEAVLALKPKNLQVQLPYDIWTQWFETLLAGAMYRLYLQPGKPYGDMQAAKLYAAAFRAGVASARAQAQAHNLTGGSSWRFPYSAQGRQLSSGWYGVSNG